MEKEGRINLIVSMYQELNDLQGTDIRVGRDTLFNNVTIEKLCEYGGPGYFRVLNWLQQKVGEARNSKKEEDAENIDMNLASQEFKKSFELMKSRNKKYGDSWKVLSIPSIANLCEMKLNRISNMDIENLDPKIEDELRDTMNYMAFALIKLNQK